MSNTIHLKSLPVIVRNSVIVLAILLVTGTSAAQENRTVDGEELGASSWQGITLADSEFYGSRDTGDFLILRNELPDRIQESWRHPNNSQHGPLVTMFYERLVDNFFAAELFEADFRSVFNLAFEARGVDLDDARVVSLDANAKVAFISYAATRCVFVMRVFGPIGANSEIPNDDRNARLFVCQRGDPDDGFLRDIALSMLSTLQQEGRSIGIAGRPVSALPALIDRLFTPEEAA
ncbi:MAG: hypothetical protein O3B37_08060 [Proteobacteria bacterium]|nr:hypothetical protein [Pseudomonadota bacterium]